MNFRQFAVKNVFRNMRLYAAYFFSCAFSVMIFFVYSMLAFHPQLDFSGQGNWGKGAQTSMDVSQYIIYIFTFFFILYSMSAFLKSRKKEFGIVMMLGMSVLQLRRLVFLENVVIGLASTIAGIGTGLLLSKGMLMLGTSVLALEQPLAFYWPVRAAWFTFAAFALLFVFISLFTAVILRSGTLIDLLKGSAKPKPEPKTSAGLAILAAALLAAGYIAAFVVKGVVVMMALLPVAFVVSVGTYFLFTQLSVYIIHKLKNRQSLYRSKTNMITLSDLAYRMKDNARMFFLVAIISTVAFCAIGTLVGLKSFLSGFVSASTAAMKYESYAGNKEQERHTALIERELTEAGIAYKPYVIRKKYALDEEKVRRFALIPATDYERLTGERATLGEREALLFYPENVNFGEETGPMPDSFPMRDGTVLDIRENAAMPASLAQITYADVLVVPDAAYEAQPASDDDSISYVYDVEDWPSTLAVAKRLMEQLQRNGEHHSFMARAYELNQLHQSFGQILLTGLFIGAVFFVAAGSFLYLRLYADLEHDRVQYRAITKLGLTEGELSKIVSTQIGLLFFVPIVVALIHGAVALNTLQNTFNANLVKESALVLGSFAAIQIVYFLIIRAGYVRKLKNVL